MYELAIICSHTLFDCLGFFETYDTAVPSMYQHGIIGVADGDALKLIQVEA